MQKKWYVWLFGILIMIPILLLIWWKSYEWVTLYRLKNIDIQVSPYTKTINSQKYDVIVVGGEPEGVAAAVSAARNGMKTLLVESRDGLGGLITYGMLNFLDYDRDKQGQIANAGIFQEWHKMVGGQPTVDISTAKKAFLKLVQAEPNITLSLNTTLVKPILSDKKDLEGIIVKDETGEHTYSAKRFIDATQNADLAAMSGVPYFVGGADIGLKDRKMSSTLMIHLKDVNWNGIVRTVLTKKFGTALMTPTAAWGFGKLHDVYKPSQPDVRLRGLNIARQSDGSVYINALQIFGVEGLDPVSVEKAKEKGEEETKHIVQFLRAEFPGFERAQIASIPPELYIRETRHIQAEYQLSIADVWENKDQWDSIGFGSYPVDIQATSSNNMGFVIADPVQYAIPFRSLVPLKVGHLLVASRCSGYSSLAAGSARIIPTGMTTAQAAGVACALSIRNGQDLQEVSKDHEEIGTLQSLLKEQGALLYPFQLNYPYEGEWFYPALKQLLTYGLITGGHENKLPVDKPMNEMAFINLITNGVDRKDAALYSKFKVRFTQARYMAKIDQNLTRDKAMKFVLFMFGYPKNIDAWSTISNKKILDADLLKRLNSNKQLTTAECYSIAATVLEHLNQIEVKGNGQ